MAGGEGPEKAKKAGFDRPDVSGALDKLFEEIEELKTAVAEGSNVEEELGDLLFSAVNVSRFVNVDAEQALTKANSRYHRPVPQGGGPGQGRGMPDEAMSLAELDVLWERAKHA